MVLGMLDFEAGSLNQGITESQQLAVRTTEKKKKNNEKQPSKKYFSLLTPEGLEMETVKQHLTALATHLKRYTQDSEAREIN